MIATAVSPGFVSRSWCGPCLSVPLLGELESLGRYRRRVTANILAVRCDRDIYSKIFSGATVRR
jgi:hypothetical protein